MSSSSMFLASAVPLVDYALTDEQRAFIMNHVAEYDYQHQNPYTMYYNLPSSEHRYLTEEMNVSPNGTVLEAGTSLGDVITRADRRIFWVKTENGIFQVSTNVGVNTLQQVVFDP